MAEPKDFKPHVLSDEEIDLYLQGDRRDIDRLILFSLNRLAAAHEVQTRQCALHAAREAEWNRDVEDMGGVEAIKERATFVNELIKRSVARRTMMEKVASSGVTWALIAFLLFLATSVWEAIVHAVKAKLGN